MLRFALASLSISETVGLGRLISSLQALNDLPFENAECSLAC